MNPLPIPVSIYLHACALMPGSVCIRKTDSHYYCGSPMAGPPLRQRGWGNIEPTHQFCPWCWEKFHILHGVPINEGFAKPEPEDSEKEESYLALLGWLKEHQNMLTDIGAKPGSFITRWALHSLEALNEQLRLANQNVSDQRAKQRVLSQGNESLCQEINKLRGQLGGAQAELAQYASVNLKVVAENQELRKTTQDIMAQNRKWAAQWQAAEELARAEKIPLAINPDDPAYSGLYGLILGIKSDLMKMDSEPPIRNQVFGHALLVAITEREPQVKEALERDQAYLDSIYRGQHLPSEALFNVMMDYAQIKDPKRQHLRTLYDEAKNPSGSQHATIR